MSVIETSKLHGLGNDFILVDGPELSKEMARALCLPRRGVGADGAISVGEPESDDADASIVIRNADGSRPEMCGNGLRCVVRYLAEAGAWSGDGEVAVETDAGMRRGAVVQKNRDAWVVEVSMGKGSVIGRTSVSRPDGSDDVTLFEVDVGNPHAVVFGEDWDVEQVEAFGAFLNDDHEAFPDGVNLEVVRPTDTDRLVVTVYERGVGLTDACGSGACAVALGQWERQRTETGEPTEVELPGGVLTVERRQQVIWLTGPAVRVFDADVYSEALGDLVFES